MPTIPCMKPSFFRCLRGNRDEVNGKTLGVATRRRSEAAMRSVTETARAGAHSAASGYTCLLMTITDRYGLEVTTSSAVAAERFQDGLARLLSYSAGDDWWFLSALAFAYHEVDRFEESRRLSERSLRQYPDNANAVHNLAHITFETLDTEGGAALLEEWMGGYDRRASFHCHLAWHMAMFELHRGRYARALEIFERDILAAVNPRSAMTDGAALLWRFRLDGKPDGPLPWRSLADLAERVSRPGFLFGEVHAALAYASCGNDVALGRLMDGLRALDAKGHPIAGTVALPLVQGTAGFAAGDHAGALIHFEPVVGEMHRIGGSHAQWELYEETMVACYLALQRYDDADRLVRRRLQRRASPRDLGWLDQATAGLAAQSRTAGAS